MSRSHQPFANMAADLDPLSPLRTTISRAKYAAESLAVAALLDAARLSPAVSRSAVTLARDLASKVRADMHALGRHGLVQGLMHEFALSTEEGVSLMCVAEALLRIPDAATRDALIRDKIQERHWESHLGRSDSVFVNAAAWGLYLTGRLAATHSEAGLGNALARALSRHGAPLLRRGVEMTMRLMAEQFIAGETIEQALENARDRDARGFRYSYDMLGESALTAEDAERYYERYTHAIDAIGRASGRRGIYSGPGISIKLSALHPRYTRAQRARVLAELYPRLVRLVKAARTQDIGVNIDAEEADRLDLSLDLLERLCHEPELTGWNGIGFVVQAYQKRATYVVDYLADLGRQSGRRLMIRLVKGAYWDSEVKRAQSEGVDDYAVFTRKVHTDVSYLACARKLLASPEAIFPQFATHNAHTLAAVYEMAGGGGDDGRFEFQCLHGMGEPLYEHVVGPREAGRLDRPCRIYAPVGTHHTLLPYLVRRLLENGANTSFVNRIADPHTPLDALVGDPVEAVEATGRAEGVIGAPHPRIPLPRNLFDGARVNSAGVDLMSEHTLRDLVPRLRTASGEIAASTMHELGRLEGKRVAVRNPAVLDDVVGEAIETDIEDVERAVAGAVRAAERWREAAPHERAAILERAADIMEGDLAAFMSLAVREAGRSLPNAVAELREAVDFLRYYAAEVRGRFRNDTHRPLGSVVCISPWNFPLSIFTGQVSAALAAGNAVLAKPAEQTPLIAAHAVRVLHAAGVPADVLRLLPGRGETVGAALVADVRVQGVVFTGSTEVARAIQRALSRRLGESGMPIPLIAETGGQNAMIVDSSALAEQAVMDALHSAFDSAGQRCSSLRVLCLQEEIAEHTIGMLKGAMAELALGPPDDLAVDIGPVIDREAQCALQAYVGSMRERGYAVYRATRTACAAEDSSGTFFPPTLIEIDGLAVLGREVFGPVLHIVRFTRGEVDRLVDDINALGYGLTLGIHSRIDETIERVVGRARVGNVYINRNMIGAVVGVQPFGGEGLSGTGPKAGGPLYVYRLLSSYPSEALRSRFEPGTSYELPGPTGESNTYSVCARKRVLCVADCAGDLRAQLRAVLALGSDAVCEPGDDTRTVLDTLDDAERGRVTIAADWMAPGVAVDAVLCHGSRDTIRAILEKLAERAGPIVPVDAYVPGDHAIHVERLLVERVVSVNTAAAGGNASLMTIG
jgi:RHH-type proline utilization regulon transcriptional repressor/proline dehydrogenase/delta 1-pyrroline-5-carboxylate dehydrogenase